MLSRYIKQLAVPLVILLVALGLVTLGVGSAAYIVIAALIALAFLLVNRGPV
jgi:hypothetical protein